MPTPSHIKAAIKRASAKARKNGNKLDAEALKELQAVYKQASEEIRLRITLMAGADGTVRLDNLRELRRQVDAVIDELGWKEEMLVTGYKERAAATAVGALAYALPTAKLDDLAGEAVRAARRFQADDGLQLSDRLWRVNNHAREVVGRAVESAIIQGNSASQAAEDFIRRGVPVPDELPNKIKIADSSAIGRATTKELMTGEGAPYHNARRLFRTEINRAHGMAYQQSVFELDDTVGTRFLLSPAHPEPDICDMHAKVNRYGLGKGVYPPGKSPWPAHPNTLSYEEVVFEDEVSAEDKTGKEDRIHWLNQQTPTVQYQVLGAQKKQQALAMGHLTENEINTPWKVLKKKYARKGIEL
ncbi:hypothetical protein [Sansalvadorimonas verongulae]|uniref:hypothetical protein n=1 Tax=Sansalvadorimonas verongulae TaxID=2172824 RepID=UPI0012BBD70E|nr:hypothetical protein [Sansalvadorimonas verongulae]MTI12105.1 hypothetical protein [Sansalvadorimonas verongulae]